MSGCLANQRSAALMFDLWFARVLAVTPMRAWSFRMAHDSGQMTVRSFYNYYEEPRSAADVENLIGRMGQIKPFQGDDWFDLTGYGETLYFPLHDALLATAANPSAEALQLWQRLGLALANNAIHLNVHAQLRGSIEGFLTAMEAINKERPIKG